MIRIFLGSSFLLIQYSLFGGLAILKRILKLDRI